MTVESAVLAPRSRRETAPAGGIGWVVADAVTVTKRNLIAFTRIPEAMFFNSVQPIMFILLFRYVFGGAISIPGALGVFLQHHYVNFLMPGIFVQTVAFGSVGTAIGMAEDLQKGLIERFRALPMARSAVMAGRAMADFVRNVFVLVLMVAMGYLVGFRVQTSIPEFLAGCGLVLMFAFALSWGFAAIGLLAPNSETAQVMSFPILFPLVFASPAFVPLQDLPGWLQAFAAHQPFGIMVTATRALMFGGPTAGEVEKAVAWCVGLLLVLVPLAVWRYRRVA